METFKKTWKMSAVVYFGLFVVVSLNVNVSIQEKLGSEDIKSRETRAADVDSMAFLKQYGYLPTNTDSSLVSITTLVEAIKAFQRMAHIPVTGQMDDTTRRKMTQPRCGMPDIQADGSRPAEFRNSGLKWRKNDLTWKISRYSGKLGWSSQKRAFYRAFKYWSDVTPLNFRETTGKPDFDIEFARGVHSDGYRNRFDGPGNVLAHAYYPENGQAHFDDDEHWTENTNQGTNLMIVATHELGHALGLGHSEVRGALMAPYYQGFDPNFKLHSDDIRGVQTIYGSRRTPVQPTRRPVWPPPTRRPVVPRATRRPTPPRPTNKPRRPKPDKCTEKYDDIIHAYDGRFYAFRRDRVWRLNEYGVDPGYPKLIRKAFSKPPKHIGAAAYSFSTRYTYLFKDDRIWKYYGTNLVSRKRMRSSSYPTKPQAALAWSDGKIYLFRGSYYWQWDERTEKVVAGPRLISSFWVGIPQNIEAATYSRNDRYTYFFKGENYFKFSNYYRRVMPGYPKRKAPAWMGCVTDGQRVPK